MDLPKHIEQIYRQSECLYPQSAVEHALDNMATAIHSELADKNPILLCVMIGGLISTAQLLLRLDFPLQLNYVHATRYRGDTRGKDVQWQVEPTTDLAGRAVLIIDDILDGGLTLADTVEFCHKRQAASVYTAVLVNKQRPRETGGLAQADFTGLTVADRYVFGYGMDYRNYLRNAPGIFVVPQEYE